MTDAHYSRFESAELILRDELAIDRTLLANERTLLAYLRSAISLLLAGVTILHFAPDGWFRIVGFACLPLGVVAAIVGIVRHHKMNQAITLVRKQGKASQIPLAARQVDA